MSQLAFCWTANWRLQSRQVGQTEEERRGLIWGALLAARGGGEGGAIFVSHQFHVEVAEEKAVGWLLVSGARSEKDQQSQHSPPPDLHWAVRPRITSVLSHAWPSVEQEMSHSELATCLSVYLYCTNYQREHPTTILLQILGPVDWFEKYSNSQHLFEFLLCGERKSHVTRCVLLTITITVSNLCSPIMTSECS